MIEVTKARTVDFMKPRNSLVAWSGDREKKEDGENLFFKALAIKFWLTSKYRSWFNKVVHGWPSIKLTSWKGNGMLLKLD